MVSILLPTFNRADLLLERALPSVLAQTYTNLEILVAAHGCTDDTIARVQALNDPRIKVFHVPRTETYPPTARNHWLAGPVVPLNAALAKAKGQWLARIDDDDAWTPDHVDLLLWAAWKCDYEFISSAYETGKGMIEHDGGSPPIGGTQTWLWRSSLRFMAWNPDCWRKVPGDNQVNDTDLAQRFREACVRIGWVHNITAQVLARPGEDVVGLAAYTHNPEATERRLAFSKST